MMRYRLFACSANSSLADALSKVGRYHFPIQLSDVTREFFAKTAELETPDIKRAMLAVAANANDATAAAV